MIGSWLLHRYDTDPLYFVFNTTVLNNRSFIQLVYTAYLACQLDGVRYGIGRHLSDLTTENAERALHVRNLPNKPASVYQFGS